MSSTGDLLRDLQRADPRLDRLAAAHLRDGAPVLPHLFLADVAECARSLLDERGRARVLAVLARHLAEGDAQVREVIGRAFPWARC